MGSICMSNDAREVRVPVRATYVNLYKWPESEAEFVRSGRARQPSVVDTISCRQMYLRSYKFSRDDAPNDTKTKIRHFSYNYCFGGANPKTDTDDDSYNYNINNNNNNNNKKKKKKDTCLFVRKVKEFSFSLFRSCLSCTATVDVVDHHRRRF